MLCLCGTKPLVNPSERALDRENFVATPAEHRLPSLLPADPHRRPLTLSSGEDLPHDAITAALDFRPASGGRAARLYTRDEWRRWWHAVCSQGRRHWLMPFAQREDQRICADATQWHAEDSQHRQSKEASYLQPRNAAKHGMA